MISGLTDDILDGLEALADYLADERPRAKYVVSEYAPEESADKNGVIAPSIFMLPNALTRGQEMFVMNPAHEQRFIAECEANDVRAERVDWQRDMKTFDEFHKWILDVTTGTT